MSIEHSEKTESRTVSTVVFSDLYGREVSLPLSVPVTIGSRVVSPFSVCRMCAYRMPLRTLEKVLLCVFLDDAECGTSDGYSYDELAQLTGKGQHSIKNAIAALKKHGLVMTSCVGKGCTRIAVSVEAFVRWAGGAVPPRSEEPHQTPRSAPLSAPEAVDLSAVPVTVEAQEGARKRRKRTPAEKDAPREPVAKKEDTPVAAPVTVPAEQPAGVDDPLAMAAPYDGEFDATEEREDTLRVAGRVPGSDDDDDEDDISLGSETSETDMGYGVRMNVNI